MARVGVLGIGLMGAAIARCLIRMGQHVVVWNRTASKCLPLQEMGARAVASPRELLSSVDVVVCVTATTDEVCEILETSDDVLADRDIINFVTGTPSQIRLLELLSERHGARFLNGTLQCYPSEIGAESTLIICGGNAQLWADRESLLKGLGGATYLVGRDVSIPNVLDSSVTANFFFSSLVAGLEAANFAQKGGVELNVFRGLLNKAMDRLPLALNELLDDLASKKFQTDQATLEIYARSQQLFVSAYKDVGAVDTMISATAKSMRSAVDAGRGQLGLPALYQ